MCSRNYGLVFASLALCLLLWQSSFGNLFAEEKTITITLGQYQEIKESLKQYEKITESLKQQNQELQTQLTIAQESLKTSKEALSSLIDSTKSFQTYLQELTKQMESKQLEATISEAVAGILLGGLIVDLIFRK